MASLAAASKKKQEEKNLKSLREIAALPANKQCFDCMQKGPTYVNTTIGSFVCVSCSGKLRGLTPPHRVKSISMANFTPEEVEFLKSRGNEFCKKVWLGFYDMANFTADSKDEQKFKDFLTAKYEAKRWYKDPTTVTKDTTNHNGISPQKFYSPVVAAATNRAPPVAVSRPVAGSTLTTPTKPSNNLADLDFFSQPSVTARAPQPVTNTLSPPKAFHQSNDSFFADFQNAFSTAGSVSSNSKVEVSPVNVGQTNGQQTKNQNVPSEDRYSALKDLDALFSSHSPKDHISNEAATPWTPSKNAWTNGLPSSTTPVKNDTAATLPHTTSNHFAFAPVPEAQSHGVWGSPTASVLNNNGFSSSNPFLNGTPQKQFLPQYGSPQGTPPRPTVFSPWGSPTPAGTSVNQGFYGQAGSSTLTNSQSVTFPIKAWPTAQNPSNPFLDGSLMTAGTAVPKTRSYNPFL